MSTARKGLLALLSKLLTPVMQRTVGNPQISGNLGLGLLARLDELDRLHLKFSRKGSLFLGHDLSLPASGPLFQVYLPHFSGSRPESSFNNASTFLSASEGSRMIETAHSHAGSSTIGTEI